MKGVEVCIEVGWMVLECDRCLQVANNEWLNGDSSMC